ncbi:MAG: beta strand repeat-containing protein, partial [Terrimicrobiaceae bacterium]
VYRDLKRDSGFEGFRGSQKKGFRDSGIKNKAVVKFRFKFQALAICAALMTFATTSWGQTSTQNFGTTPATYASQTGSTGIIPNPNSGTTYARAGAAAAAAPIVVTTSTPNPLGTAGAYLRAVASTSTSVSKASPIAGYTGGKEFYTSFKVLFGDSSGANTATTGSWTFYQGAGGTFTDNQAVSNTQAAVSLRFTYGSSGAVALAYANVSGNYVSTGLTSTSLSQGTVYTVEVVKFNGASGSTKSYSYNGSSKALTAGNFDLYINGTQIASNLASSGLSLDTSINSTTFTGISSTGNAANLFVDDFVVYNAVPATIGAAPTAPTLTAATLGSAMSTTVGTASTGVSFTAAGANLNTDITVTPQTGYEVSTTSASAGFGSSAINVANSTTVWVRFTASMALGTYNSATAVVLTGGGASSSANVTTSGSGNNVSPTNDLSSVPTSVTVNGSAANGTTAAATYSTITSDANSKTDVWFSLTATEGGTVTLTTTSTTSQDLDIQAWAGPAAPTSTTGQSVLDGADSGNTSEVATFTAVAGTTYFVRVLQFSGTAGSFTITATMPLSPSNQATSFTSSSITSSSATVGWTRGNGTAGVLVVARAIGAVNADPINGTTYTANAAFGSGNQIGTGNYVVYKGTGTSVSVTGLSPSTAYHFAVYEYNATGLMHN